jgi:copper resistance protein C
VIIIIALLVIAGLVAPAALAHAQLLRADPEDGATLTTTDQVVLTFNETINPDFVQIVVTGPDGPVSLEDASVDGALVTQAITPTSSGPHTVTYRVVSADGHPVSGQIGFTLTEVPAPVTPDPTSQAPTTPAQPTVLSAQSAPVGADDVGVEEGGAARSPLLVLTAAAVLLGLGGAIAWAARRRRHPQH